MAMNKALLFAVGGVALATACTIKTYEKKDPNAPTPTTTVTAAPAPTEPAPEVDAGYDPCAGKACGERCRVCNPKDTSCLETAVIKMCHPDGQCLPATAVDCSGDAGAPPSTQ